MHLKRLELCGFKTFPERTVLEFTEAKGIVAIVGPNGCGKSNIIDAFRWVMGEQSIKLLRGTTQEEIIFSGTEDRKPLSLAEVILTIDNSDHQLSTDYSEVQIGRRLYRSGESEYLLNKQIVRLKDIQELLMDTGIGKGSYAIIGQGQVMEILHSKPEDRRTLFEEAAGINKYKTRKIVSERKLATAEQNLTRLKDIRSEIHQQLGPLEEQARIAKEYQILKKDLAQLEIGLFKVKIGKIDEFRQELVKGISEFKTMVAEADNKAENITQKKQEFKNKIVELDQKLTDLNQHLKDLRASKADFHNKLNVTAERINHQKQRLSALENELAALEKNKESLALKQNETQLELQASKRAVSEFQEKLTKKNAETSGIFDLWQNVAQELSQLKHSLAELEELIENKKSKIMGLESSERVISSDIQRLLQSIETVNQDQEELNRKEQELSSRKVFIENKISELHQKRDSLFKQKSAKETERKELLALRSEIKEKFDSQSSRLNLLEEMQQTHEGFQKGVRSVFQARKENLQGFTAIHGVIADILSVPKKYEAAIEAALENNLQAIVTTAAAPIKDIIRYLREHSLGRASFISADRQSAADNSNPLGQGQIAAEIVTCPEQYQGLVRDLLNTVVIVDNLEEALKLFPALQNSRLKAIVTLAGEIISQQGVITGGSTGKDTVSLLGRQREIIELKKDIEDYKNQLTDLDRQNKEIDQLFVFIENDLKNYGGELNSLEIEQGTVANDLARIAIDREKLLRLLQSNAQNKAGHETELEKINTEKNNVNNALQKILQDKETQLAILRAKEQALASANAERDKVNELLTEIKIGSTNAEGTLRQIELKLESFLEAYQQTLAQIEQKTTEKELLSKEKITAEQALNDTQAALPEMDLKLAEIESHIQTETAERSRYFNDLDVYDRLEKERSNSDREIRSKLAEEEIKMARVEAEATEMNRRLTNEYGLTIEDVLKIEGEITDYEKTQDEVEKLRRRIKRMEPVNLLAIEEYEAQKERLVFIETQCSDLEKSQDDLQKIIKELDHTAIDAFRQSFELVNQHFQKIFVELFQGGYGELKIMDENDILNSGIEIYAKVPGTKRIQSMTLLSGGQKALTAIALLFSLLSAKPGPFCILDEIDAELDDVNITRVTNILQKYSQETQIIIITHRQPTMSVVGTMFGLTMELKGVSKVVSVKLPKKEAEAETVTV